jgi:hypothetical protein
MASMTHFEDKVLKITICHTNPTEFSLLLWLPSYMRTRYLDFNYILFVVQYLFS